MTITNGYCTLAELKRYLGIDASLTAATIAFVDATKKITDSNLGLEIFPTGATITVSGSTSNDGTYTVATGSVAAEIVTSEALTDEAAGDTVTIVDISNRRDDPLLETLVEAASRAIDTYCNRRFYAATATRYYESDAVDGCYLHLDDDLLTITTLTNGDSSSTVIPNTEYWLWPRNETPYWAIRLEAGSTYAWEVDTDYMISVLGTWGWAAAAPDNIKHACIRYAAYLYHQKDAPTFDTTVIPEAGIITVPKGIPEDVRLLLAPYVKGPQ